MSFAVRMSILGLLLVVGLCGLGWEYLLVLPGFNDAQAKLEKLAEENIKLTADQAKTRADVVQFLKKTPSEVKIVPPPKKKGDDDKSMRSRTFIRHDRYNYYHAMPWKKPLSIIVVYKRLLESEDELEKDATSFPDNQWVFSAVHFNSEVPSAGSSSVSKDATNPGDQPMAAGGGGPPPVQGGKGGPGRGGAGQGGPGRGGPGRGGPGRGGPGGGRGQFPSPEELIKENDKNDDGKLSGEEIPERMKNFVDRIDEDKDGAISLDELKAARERMQRRGGGRGGPGRGGPGSGAPGKRGPGTRPTEDDSTDGSSAEKEPAKKTGADQADKKGKAEKPEAKKDADPKPSESTDKQAGEKADPEKKPAEASNDASKENKDSQEAKPAEKAEKESAKDKPEEKAEAKDKADDKAKADGKAEDKTDKAEQKK